MDLVVSEGKLYYNREEGSSDVSLDVLSFLWIDNNDGITTNIAGNWG